MPRAMLYGFQLSPRKVSPHLSNQELSGVFLSPWPFPPPTSLHGPKEGKIQNACYETGKPEMQTVGVASNNSHALKRENKKGAQIMATMPAS